MKYYILHTRKIIIILIAIINESIGNFDTVLEGKIARNSVEIFHIDNYASYFWFHILQSKLKAQHNKGKIHS